MNNIGWGLQISALGMGLVFALLALLWGVLTLVLKLDKPEPPVSAESATPTLDPALVAAITVAVAAHSAARRGEAAPQMRTHWPGSLLHASRWVAAGRARQNHSWRRVR